MYKEPRILHLLKTLDVGGVERSTINYSNELVNDFDHISMLSSDGIFFHEGKINNKIKVSIMNSIRHLNILNYIQFIIRLFHLVSFDNINVLHYHHRVFSPAAYILHLFRRHIKIVYTHHNQFNDLVNNFIYADKIIAVSQTTCNDLPKRLHNKTEIIVHGTKIGHRKEFKKIKNLAYVGRLTKGKGIFKIIDLFATLEKTNNINLLIRGDGQLSTSIIQFITVNDFENKIKILPPATDLEEIYGEVDILILLSNQNEGFGLSALEAMSFGIPVIVSEQNCFHELLDKGECGIIIKDYSSEFSISQVQQLINNRHIYKEFSENAYLHTINNYQLKNTISKYIRLYKQL